MFGKKKKIDPCNSCDRPISPGQKVCSCGSATTYMDFEERTRHEVQQWRRFRERAAS